ncbi:MAG TPA: SDR family oxidoreductase [Kiritimatiellia bacterium]|nr:SDR family oxidoreductase [Kiritimatiellia bacterium]
MKHSLALRLLIVGAGYVGDRLAHHVRQRGGVVWTLRRTPTPEAPFSIAADLTQPETIPFPSGITHILISAGLQRAQPQHYQHLFDHGLARFLSTLPRAAPALQRIIFCSTTGVYHETNAAWVDETTPPNPIRDTASFYLQAEQHIQNHPASTIITRLSGIYGPGRNRLVREVQSGTARRLPGPVRYLNHIRVEDAVGALTHLLHLPQPAPLYLLTDHEPADRNLVLEHIAEKLNLPLPPWLDSTDLPPLGRGGNKRCSNQRLLESGYTLRFPTYREGYPVHPI